jgi:hypothetical protein
LLARAIAKAAVCTKAKVSEDFRPLNRVNVGGRSFALRATIERVTAAPIPAPTRSVDVCPSGRLWLLLALETSRFGSLRLWFDFIDFAPSEDRFSSVFRGRASAGRVACCAAAAKAFGSCAVSVSLVVRASLGIDRKALDYPAPLNELHDEYYEGGDEQQMEQAAQGVGRCKADSPQHE